MKKLWILLIIGCCYTQAWAQTAQPEQPDAREAEEAPPEGEAAATQPGSVVLEDTAPMNVELTGADIDVQVVGDSVLLRGNERDIAILQALIDRLERETPERAFRVLRLENKNAQEVAQAVQEMMTDLLPGAEPRPAETVTIRTISNNILLVTGPESRLDEVESIVQKVDEAKPTLPDVEQMVFLLEHVKAAEAKVKLEEMIATLRRRQGEDPATEIIVTVNDANNSLVVTAPETERKKIQGMIDVIDVESAEGFGDLTLGYYPLLNSEATQMAEMLKELLLTAEGAEDAAETIRRIRMLKSQPGPDGEIEELPPINLERQIKVIADEESQAIIVATSEQNIEPLRELINLLDVVPVAVDQGLRIFPLEHADAVAAKDMLDAMFEQGKELPKPAPGNRESTAVPDTLVGQSLVYNISIVADARTNTLFVAGREPQLELIAQVIQDMDRPATEIHHPLRLITLVNLDATRLASMIEGLWEKRIEALEATEAGAAAVAREQVYVSVDLRSNSLVISALEKNFKEILEMVRTLDEAPDRSGQPVQVIDCGEYLSAGDMKAKIDELWQRKAELRGESELPQDAPIVVSDQRTNSLIVAASQDDFEEIKGLVETLKEQPSAPLAEIRLIELQNNDATQIAEMLQQLFEERMEQRAAQGQEEDPMQRVAIAPEPATNTLLIASSKANYDEVVSLVERLDREPDLDSVIRFFPLENAQAETVAEKIRELFESGLYTGQVTGDSPISERRQQVTLIADSRSNSLLASASPQNLGIIEKLVEQMDTERAPMINADTRIFELEHADAVKLADMLGQLFEGMAGDAGEDFIAPTLIPEPSTNTLIVTGSRDAIKRATDLIESLDVRPEAQTAIRVYPLDNASATKLTTKMQEVFEARTQGGGAQAERTPVFLMPDEATNSIIATASEEDHTMIEHLVSLLDVRSTISKQVQIFPLQRAKAEPTAESLETLFESRATTGGGGGGRADVIAVEADRRTNSLIVWAAESEMENIAEIIRKLDTSAPGQEMMIKVITLKRALADELSETLLETLSGGQQAGGDDEQAVILTFEDVLPDGTTVLRRLFRQDVTIQPDQRTNSLFVMAPAESMGMLESLILSIDRIPPSLQQIRMFPLANADAEEVVEVLESLFEEQTGTGEGPETRLELGNGAAVSGPAGAGALTGQSTPGQVLRFTANRRTNMVIAAGSETDLAMIEGLIRELDAQDAEDRVRMVYEARYVPAADVASALRDYFEEENDLLGDLQDESSIMRQAERHVTVIGNEESNSVLIGVSPRYYSRTMEMLYSIDRPPPQVMIQVLIAELALDDRLEFGMEWALQDLAFSQNAVVGPNGTVQGSDFDVVGGTSVGAAGTFGGFTFSITGEDFSYLLHALQSDGSLEVLSRPTILVANNQEANITIGDEVPFVRSSNVSDSGQVNSNVEYEDVGIILDVTPHINPDGYVNLEIAPEISALNQGSSVQISENLTAPTFSNRKADTVVTVKDGETVVIGGLIQTQEDQRETKVPVVGDIPVVGNLFRATTSQRRRTELLIVLTVNVIWDEHDAYVQSVKLRDQSGFLPEKVKRSPLMEGLRILPGEDEEEYPLERQQPRYRRRDSRPDDLPLYGPSPQIYGPKRPNGDDNDDAADITAMERYGPPSRRIETASWRTGARDGNK